MAAKNTAPFVALTDLRHDGDSVAVGEIIDLTEAQAIQLVELGAVEPAPTEVAAPAKAKK